MGFLSGLFGKKAPEGPLQWEEVEGKPYLAVLEWTQDGTGRVSR
jgi:hypothetical protein